MYSIAQRPLPSYWLYKDNAGEWRWTYHGKNGEEIAVSSESYKRRIDANHAIDLMKASHGSEVWLPGNVATDQ